METYKVKILTPGHFIVFRGRRTRSPVTFFNVYKKELDFLEMQVRRSLLKWQVELDLKLNKTVPIQELKEPEINEDLSTEEFLNSKSEGDFSILESLLSEDKKL